MKNQWSNLSNEKTLRTFIKQLDAMIKKLDDVSSGQVNYKAFGKEGAHHMDDAKNHLRILKDFFSKKIFAGIW